MGSTLSVVGNITSSAAPSSANHLTNKAYVDAAVAGSATYYLESGTYTPSRTLVTNLSAINFNECTYQVIGGICVVYGSFSFTAGTTASCQFSMSVPKVGDATIQVVNGYGTGHSSISNCKVEASPSSTSQVTVSFSTGTFVNGLISFSFQYKIGYLQ